MTCSERLPAATAAPRRPASLPLLLLALVLHCALAAAAAASNVTGLSRDLEVDPPVYTPAAAACEQTLMVHVFAYSYGEPFVGAYEPPACDFNRVIFNLTVTSAGTQYDRLALMYFNDTEIFRTSTAEPTTNGIVWTYLKDMSAYLSLFTQPQKIIFDLGNIVNDEYTGTFNTTLTATYYSDDVSFEPADLIVPISARASVNDSASSWDLPGDNATNSVTLPQNVNKAIFSIAACGQSEEEFWWSNVLESDVDAFGSGSFYGYSPFRELQLYIDGTLAGVAWPFPVIFTGGVVPGFWRPVVGIDAFDLKEDQIDITPWLPLLCDGAEHAFEIRVTGVNDTAGSGTGVLSETVNSYWVVTGKIFLWLDSAGSITTGSTPVISAPDPSISLSSSASALSNGTNETLHYTIAVSRALSVSATVLTHNGSTTTNASWTQSLTYSNTGNITDQGYAQGNTQSTTGTNTASSWARAFSYPLWVWDYFVITDETEFIGAEMSRGKDVTLTGTSAFPLGIEGSSADGAGGSKLATTQNGSATYYYVEGEKSTGTGSTEQDLTFAAVDSGGEEEEEEVLFTEHILAVNGSVVYDSVEDQGVEEAPTWQEQGREMVFLAPQTGVRSMLGRNPGTGGRKRRGRSLNGVFWG